MLTQKIVEVITNDKRMSERIDMYMKNDMKKLKTICLKVWGKKVDNYLYDELFDLSMDVLMESTYTYDENSSANFETFLTGNIARKTYTWMRDNMYRSKRSNLLKDAKGKLILDEKNNPQLVINISLDSGNDESQSILDTIAWKNTVEGILFDNQYTDKVDEYLNVLPKRQRRVAELLSQEYTREDIRKILNIGTKELNDLISGLKKYEYISILF